MKSVLQLEERLGFLLNATACQYLLPVRNKSQLPEKYSEIPHSTLFHRDGIWVKVDQKGRRKAAQLVNRPHRWGSGASDTRAEELTFDIKPRERVFLTDVTVLVQTVL